jgi:photosynthetic reaction center M subunit
MPPLNDGGWYIISSFFLLVSVMSWWLRTYLLAAQHKMGKHIAWAFLARSGCSWCWVSSVRS